MGKGRRRTLGEGNTEYVILLTFVLVCAVVGLFTSYSSTIAKIQLEKGLCLDCVQNEKMQANNTSTPAGTTTAPPSGTAPPTDPNAPPSPAPPPIANSIADLPSAPAPDSIQSWWTSFEDFLSWW